MNTDSATEYRDPGDPPVLDWIDVNLIDIDPAYQRGLDDTRVQRILDWFTWDAFGAIVIAPAAEGRYNCTDGQHRLAAARRHPAVSVVPAIIIHAQGTQAEAENFIAINKDRRNISALDRYWAEVAANEPTAIAVSKSCESAGVTVMRHPSQSYGPGETVSISAIRAVVDKRGTTAAQRILAVCADAGLAPIKAEHIRAAEFLLTDDEFCHDVEPEALAESMVRNGEEWLIEARAFSATHRMPVGRALASVWFRRTRKKRRVA